MRVLRWAGRLWTGALIIVVLLAALLLGLRLLLPAFSSPPALLATQPAAGADTVSPRTSLVFHFSAPMNPRSVERALLFAPALPWQPIWNADRTTLTISPTGTLQPDTSYRLRLDTRAQSQRFRALDQPAELRFRTAPAPAVVQVLPLDQSSNVPLLSPISIQFSRTIVTEAALLQPAELPALRFEPPIEGRVIWIDQATALFRPAAPLQPGTRYRATLDAALADTAGTPLNSPFVWSFSTPAPVVQALAPAAGASMIAPRATLAITLSQPLDLDSVRASLVITPALAGDLAAAALPDGRQVLRFTPAAGWQPATTYLVSVGAGTTAAGGNLPLPALGRWSFTTAPAPALTGRFPGEGQTLPPGQEIRLIFTTPMDADALRAAIQLTPTAPLLRITASENDVRIAADLRSATTYTMTLPASLADRNSVPLGRAYQLRFLSAPAGPALALPDAPGHLAQALPGQPVHLLLARTNLSALNFDLYRLDEAAIVRTLDFGDADWSLFQPERYGQPLLRSWSTALADQLNTPVSSSVLVTATNDSALAAGAYYLRVRTPEGPRADLLLLVSRTRLALQTNAGAALIWATDVISGTPLGGVPIALYGSSALLQQGSTDTNGLLRFARTPGSAPIGLVAIASGPQIAVASDASAGTAAPDRYRGVLVADSASYRPGERVELGGIIRANPELSGTLALPRSANVSVRSPAGRIYAADQPIGVTGVFSAALALAADAPPGVYAASATFAGATVQTSFTVQLPAPAPLHVAISAPPSAAGAPIPIAIQVRTPAALPVASAAISWTLQAVRVPFPIIGDYGFGDDERAPSLVPDRHGSGQTDQDGRFDLVISDTVAGDMPVQYQLLVQAREPGGLAAVAESAFQVAPAPILAGVYLPSRIFAAGSASPVDILALAPDQQPVAGANLRVEVYQRVWERSEQPHADGSSQTSWQPRDTLAFVRSITAGADGRASLPLTLPSAGAYRLRVSSVDPAGQAAWSAATVWATAPGFTGWGELPGGAPLLIADRASYRPGDTATLLLAAPDAEATVLLTSSTPRQFVGEARLIRAGEPFTLTVRAEDAPALQLAVLFAGSDPLGANALAPPAPKRASAILAVLAERPALAATLSTDAASYAPGATATLTVTTVDTNGAGVPADLIVSIAGGSALSPEASAPPDDRSYWNTALRTNASGTLTLTVPLPRAAMELRAQVWAASAAGFSQAARTIAITEPLALDVDLPAFFRPGDQATFTAEVRNTSAITQPVQVNITSAGLQLNPASAANQTAVLAPGARQRFSWRAQVLPVAGVRLSVSARAGDATPQSVALDRPIITADSAFLRGGALVDGQYTAALSATNVLSATPQLLLEVGTSSAALARADAAALTAMPERSLLDDASLLLLTAPLSDTQSLAQTALDRLLAAQNNDGGWGWWPRTRSQPFVTAVVLEAIAAARSAGFAVAPALVERALAQLEQDLREASISDDRAQLLYVQSLYNRADAAQLRALAEDNSALGPAGLAYLLLSRAPNQAADRAALDRLVALAQSANDTFFWQASRASAAPESDASVTALALLALERGQSGDTLAAGARRWLLAAQPASSYDRARMFAALRPSDPTDAAALLGRYRVTLNASDLLEGALADVFTRTQSLQVQPSAFRNINQLAVASSGSLFLRYQFAAPAPASANGIALLREYLDPISGAAVDPAQLRLGQLVRVRLTAVIAAPQRFLAISEPLPSGAALLAADDSADFEHVGATDDHITLARASAAPGIYQASYLLRAVAAGRYAVPAPTASGAFVPAGRGIGSVVEVRAR